MVRERLQVLRPAIAEQVPVEEVFPGLQVGNRAGMITVQLPPDLSDEELDAILDGLREDKDVEYAESAMPRSRRLRK